ncbi:hypothetical protein [Treponema pectinovorum]|uniref:hypothetical protein n=1 Tax=Treponema pectinovorum TaxID=164 RepID=UPI001C9C3477|nr:hypothetical protein [Treponema pectinovorum]
MQNLRIETFADFRKCKKDAGSVCNQLTLNCLTNLKRSENFALLRNFDSKIKKVCESNNLQKKYVSDEIRSILGKIESLKKISTCEVNVERQKNPRVNIRLKYILKHFKVIKSLLE